MITARHDNNIVFDKSSYVDPHGRVFYCNDKIYRNIYPESSEFVHKLFVDGTAQKLVSDGLLVDSTISKDLFPGHDLVLEHRRIDMASYCVEWPFHLLKKAAIHTLNLSIALLPEDMYLQDAYPWNIFFEGTQSVFIDFTSIVPAETDVLWPAYQQFCQFFLFPLYLYSHSQGKVTRALQRDYLHGVGYREFEKLVPSTFMLTHPFIYLKRIVPEKLGELANRSERMNAKVISRSKDVYAKNDRLKKDRLKFYKDLLADVEAITIPDKKTRWTAYYADEAKELACKLELVSAIVKRLKPTTVLDVGCNTGEFSILAAKNGATVVSFDNDESCVERLARRADDFNLPILPLVMDFSNPTPSFGWSAQQFPSAPERFRSEMVMALAVIHHLVFHQRQDFQRIIEGLQRYLGRWLVIEFIDIADSYIQRWSVNFERYQWYTRAGFEEILHSNFQSVQHVGSVADTRHLYLCEI